MSRHHLRGQLSKPYIITEHDDGTVTLEPAPILTAFERAYLASEARRTVENGRAAPECRRKWEPRSAGGAVTRP